MTAARSRPTPPLRSTLRQTDEEPDPPKEARLSPLQHGLYHTPQEESCARMW